MPGSVQDDLWRAGSIADPYVARNSLLSQWVSERTWVYAIRFQEPPRPAQGCRLRFEGIDFEADVYLNGEFLGHHRGMFGPAEFQVGHLLRAEPANALAVIIHPAPREESQVGRTDRVRTAKSRLGYGWERLDMAVIRSDVADRDRRLVVDAWNADAVTLVQP